MLTDVQASFLETPLISLIPVTTARQVWPEATPLMSVAVGCERTGAHAAGGLWIGLAEIGTLGPRIPFVHSRYLSIAKASQ